MHAGGDSAEAAIADAEIVIAEVVDELLRSKEPVPGPSAVADIPAEDRDGAEFATLVPVHLPGKSKVISITLDEELIARIDAVAANRSGFLAEAARARLRG